MMKEQTEERKIIIYTWVYVILGFFILLIVSLIWFKEQLMRLPISFVLGWATNLMCFTMNVKIIDFVLKNGAKNAKTIFVLINVLKLLIYGLILTVAYLAPGLEIFSAFVGMLAVKITLYFKTLIVEPIVAKRKKSKEEPKDGGSIG